MALKHDAQGFLVGDPIDLGRLVEEWAAIKDDVRAIRRAIVGGGQVNVSGQASSRVVPIAAVPRTVAGRQRLAAPLEPAIPNSGFSGAARRERDGAAVVMKQAVAALRASQATTLRAPAQPARRDSRGRFVAWQTANQKKPGKRPGDDPRDDEEREEGLIRSISERVGGAFKEAGTGLEEADPAVKAISEIAQPVARGFELMTGGDGQKKQERWLRRIFNTLTGSRKEQGLFNKIAAKRLKAIEEKPAETSGGGLLGGLLGGLGEMLMKIPVIGGLLSAGGAAAGGIGKLLMGGGKGFLRKIPILGGLLASFGAAAEIYGAETDDTLTRGEKDKRTGKAAGGLAGTLGGLWAGAKLGAAVGALGGPIGAAIGGVVGGAAGMFFGDRAGQVVGQTVGGWVSDLREADIGGMIAQKWDATVERFSTKWDEVSERFSSKWNELTDGLKSKWDSLIGDLKGLWGDITSAAEEAFDWVKKKGDQANDYIKSVTGVDMKETARAAVTSTKEVAASAIETVKEAGSAANKYILDKTGVDLGQSAADAASRVRAGAGWLGEKASGAGRWFRDRASGAFNSTAEALAPGYRHRERFDGIRGGAGLAKNGTYTSSEAERIRQLKTSGANTGANLAGGMPADIQQKIRASAEANGLDPDMMLSIAAMESGGNANAISSTGAIGIFQFTGRTATGVGIKDRFDVDQNIEGGMKLTRQNAAMLEKRGLPVTPENLYMAHQLGPSAAAEVIAGAQSGRKISELSDSARRGIGLNYGSSSTTAAEYLAKNRAALESRYDNVVARSDAGVLPQPSMALAQPPANPEPGQPSSMDARRSIVARYQQENEERVQRNLEAAGQTTPMMEQERALAAAQGGVAPVASAATPAAPAAPVVANAAMPAAVSLAAPAAPAVAVASVPTVPSAPASPPIADAPPVSVPMASNDSRKAVAVVSPSPEVGQDLRERGIAHIATGGLGKG